MNKRYTKETYRHELEKSIEYYMYILSYHEGRMQYNLDKAKSKINNVDQENITLEDYLPKIKPRLRPNDTDTKWLYEDIKISYEIILRRISYLRGELRRIDS